MTPIAAELIVDSRCRLGEGPLWSVRERCLYWIDIESNRVHRYDPATRATAHVTLPSMIGAVVERASGGLVIADQAGFAALDFATGALERWTHPEATIPTNRFNDGKVDPQGRFWCGTMQIREGDADAKGKGSLWCLHADKRVTRLVDGLSIANGLAWDGAGTFYYIDTPTQRIDAFSYDAAAPTISRRRVAVPIDGSKDGWPDGMCIDAEGMLWCGHWGGWAVHRWDPRTGRKLATVAVPATAVTSCCFGGERLDELWITTAARSAGADATKEPHAGGVFRARPGVTGLAATPYAG